MEHAHDLSPGLLRQRRNLMLTSSASLFLSFAQAKIQSFQILGISASFGRPEAVVYGLAVLTLYFIYRYALYLMQEPGNRLETEFYALLNNYARDKIISIRNKKFPSGHGLEILEQIGARRSNRFTWTVLVQSEKDGMGGYETGELIISLKDIWIEAIKASLIALISRSYFSDYFFPFLFASLALLMIIMDFS